MKTVVCTNVQAIVILLVPAPAMLVVRVLLTKNTTVPSVIIRVLIPAKETVRVVKVRVLQLVAANAQEHARILVHSIVPEAV